MKPYSAGIAVWRAFLEKAQLCGSPLSSGESHSILEEDSAASTSLPDAGESVSSPSLVAASDDVEFLDGITPSSRSLSGMLSTTVRTGKVVCKLNAYLCDAEI